MTSLPKLYLTSSLLSKIEKQRKLKSNVKPLCLFSDLDDSYILKYWPTEDILEKYSQKYTDTILSPDLKIYEPTIALKNYLDQNSIPLIVVSGRDMHQMNELRKVFIDKLPNSNIMNFDGIIGAVGTEIYINDNSNYTMDPDYYQLLEQTSFNRKKIYEILESLIIIIRERYKPESFDFSKRDKHNSVDELPQLSHKLSLEFKTDDQTSKDIINFIKSEFQKNNFPSINTLMSCPYNIREKINKYNIDVVPVSKDKPILYLKELLDVFTIVAGDSGNDFDMLTKSADYGIIVGNAKTELTEALSRLPKNQQNHMFFAAENLRGPDAILYALKNKIHTA